MTSRRTVRVYLTIGFALLLTPTFFVIFGTGNIKHIKSLSPQKKMELMSLGEYKKLGIETLQEFDHFWDKIRKLQKLAWLKISITIAIFFGLIFFLKSVYVASVAYISLVILNFAVRDLSRLFEIPHPPKILFPNSAAEIPGMIFLLIYLVRRKTRQHYFQLQTDNFK